MLDQLYRELDPIDRTLHDFARRQPGCQGLIANLYGVGAVTARRSSPNWAMRAASEALTTPSATAASTSPSGSQTRNAPPAASPTKAPRCCAGRSSKPPSAPPAAAPDHAYYLQVADRLDHNRACLSLARKLCRRAHHILRGLGDEALAPIAPAPTVDLEAAA
jgi:transposase